MIINRGFINIKNVLLLYLQIFRNKNSSSDSADYVVYIAPIKAF